MSPEPGTNEAAWRNRAGRIGLGATLLASLAIFASALGGIASIDVNAGTAAAPVKPDAAPPTYHQSRGVEVGDRDCPEHKRGNQKTSQS